MNTQEAIGSWADRVLRIGITNKWDNHLTEPLYKNVTGLKRLTSQHASRQAVIDIAHDLEGSLMVCASVQLAPMPDIERLVDDLHSIVESYNPA